MVQPSSTLPKVTPPAPVLCLGLMALALCLMAVWGATEGDPHRKCVGVLVAHALASCREQHR